MTLGTRVIEGLRDAEMPPARSCSIAGRWLETGHTMLAWVERSETSVLEERWKPGWLNRDPLLAAIMCY
jgi:hypothetical protein